MKYIIVNLPSVKWINFVVILILCDNISSTSGENCLLSNSSITKKDFKVNENYLNLFECQKDKFKIINEVMKSQSKRSIFRKIIEPLFGYEESTSNKITLLGLFELTTQKGLSELAAAKLAVKHINENNILNGYELDLKINDTQCDAGVSVDRFFHAIYSQNKTKMMMLLSSSCSEVTETLAKIVQYWSVIMVSFGTTAPALSDRDEFPYFFRTVMPDSAHNPARISFIQYFKWDSVVTFSQKEEIYSLAINDIVTQLERANISCSSILTFSENDYKEQLKVLKDLDTRIIIGSFSLEKFAAKVFCEAHNLGMYGDYVWILPESENESWWNFEKSNCSIKNLHDTIENVIFVSSFSHIIGHEKSINDLTKTRFEEELSAMNITKPYSRNILTTYDAIWSIALVLKNAEELWKNQSEVHALQELKKLNQFDYNRIDFANEFVKQFAKLKFQGISGPVSFDGNDRIGITIFKQIQNSQRQPIALFHPEIDHLNFNCPFCTTIKWKNNNVPIAKRFFKLRYVTISNIAFFTISSCAVIGIISSIMFLAFNLHFRKLKSIKLSSYKLSNITAVGCIFIYSAVILLGLDHSSLPFFSSFPTICMARVYLLSSGFSLTFGSMFAKTYRVHRIFIHNYGGIFCRDKMLKDRKLISLICCLLLVDTLFITCWTLIDPMQRNLRNLTLEISHTDRSVVYQPQVEVCESLNTKSWLLFLYAYKGLLLAVGVYMAWETRNVKIPALNDSKYIGISVYGAVITSVSVVVFANILADKVTTSFIIIAVIILISTTATLCLVFVPKMSAILNKEVQEDAVIHSMGLKMEYNTRRFAIDDKKELQYRVEVQNRVYLKELEALDAEIKTLEKMLGDRSSSSRTSSSHSIVAYVKPEIVINDSSSIDQFKSPRTSVTNTLPLLLLSVLPPVIPRASWPNAEQIQSPIRQSHYFSSHPQIPSNHGSDFNIPAIDLLNLRLNQQQQEEHENVGLFKKIKNLFGSRGPSRKESTTSLATSHITNAIRSHVNMLSDLFPHGSSNNSIDRDNWNVEKFKKASVFTINIVEDDMNILPVRKHRIILTNSLSNIEESLKDTTTKEMNLASKWKSLEEEALYVSSNKF